RRLVHGAEVGAVKADAARGRRHQLQEAARDRALAAARLADQAQRLALADGEADAVDRLHLADRAPEHDPPGDRKVLLQVADLDQDLLAASHPAVPCSSRARGPG